MPRLLIATCLTISLAVAPGCESGGKHAARLSSKELGSAVLQTSDLPKGYERFDFGRQTRLDAHAGPRADATRFDRQDGWKARYRSDPAQKSGSAIVESRVDVFADAAGAKRDLRAYAEEFAAAKTQGWRILPDVPAIGDDSRGATLVQGPAQRALRTYTIAWRDGRATASITIVGFGRSTSLDDVVGFARRQQARLDRALSTRQ
ncbi:MAG: hypothetical protein ABI948_07995 [Thermoleophilia bacterium]